jgi:tetratricopeptide (TPR) repeat protein
MIQEFLRMKLQKVFAIAAVTFTLVPAMIGTNYQAARAESPKREATTSTDPEVLWLRAMEAFAKKEFEQAIDLYGQVLALTKPGSARYLEALESRARVFGTQKQENRAITDFSEILKYKPQYAPAYRFRGLMYGQINKTDLALADADKALEIEPKNVDYLIDRAFAHYYTNSRKKAKADLKAAQNLLKEQGNEQGLKEVEKIMKTMGL